MNKDYVNNRKKSLNAFFLDSLFTDLNDLSNSAYILI